MPTGITNEVSNVIIEIIIPNNNVEWPSFCDELRIHQDLYSDIISKNLDIIDRIHKNPDFASSPERAVRAAEAEFPEAFAAFYRDLCDVYYSLPAVVAKVAEIAEAGPKEASPHFDASLLDGVIASQAGRGRY